MAENHAFPLTPPTACNPASILEIDSVHTKDSDDSDLTSLTDSIIDYEFENGRRYHAYKAGHYPLPNDEHELDRLDLQHHVLSILLSGELCLAPLRQPEHILDLGTGTGIWAIEMADRFPNAQIVGTDLSPTQPLWVPDNISFEVDDFESEWLYPPDYFDMIHARYLLASVSDWQRLVRQGFRHCKPGGFLELQELDPRLCSDDGTHQNAKYYLEYMDLILGATAKMGKPVPHYWELEQWLVEAGFVDVRTTYFKIPVNTWPRDKRLKEVGRYQCLNYCEGLEAISVALFTRVLGWTQNELQVFLARIRQEMRDRSIHLYQIYAVVHGRKPFPGETAPRHAQTGAATGSTASSRDLMPPPPIPRRVPSVKANPSPNPAPLGNTNPQIAQADQTPVLDPAGRSSASQPSVDLANVSRVNAAQANAAQANAAQANAPEANVAQVNAAGINAMQGSGVSDIFSSSNRASQTSTTNDSNRASFTTADPVSNRTSLTSARTSLTSPGTTTEDVTQTIDPSPAKTEHENKIHMGSTDHPMSGGMDAEGPRS